MNNSKARVLVVDDYQPWRQFVTSTLRKHSQFSIVGEVSDGLTAVEKARDLLPDLILLDIGLPKLNGLEAARKIRLHSIDQKILFVSENSSPDIVKAALGDGGGYVLKSDAGGDLLPAMTSVLQGTQFVSRRFAGLGFATSACTPSVRERGHVVQFYAQDSELLDNLSALFTRTLNAGQAAIAVTTGSHRIDLQERLIEQGIDVDQATSDGRLAILDAEETLSTFMDADAPNRERFFGRVGCVIRRAEAVAGVNRPLVVFGEMVAVLGAQKRYQAAIRLEKLWNELMQNHSFYLCCAYPASGFAGESNDVPYATICAEHSHVVSTF